MNVTSINNQTSIGIIAGETVALSFALSQASGAAMDLTGYSLKCQINVGADPLTLNTMNGGITVPSPTTGQCVLNIASAVTASMPPGSYPYDVWIVSGAGVETPIFSGNFSVTANVSPVP